MVPSHQTQSPVWSLRKGCWTFAPFSNPGYASGGGWVLVAGGRMMRMPGPGGVVVMMGGQMTRMLGPGSPGGSGGCGGLRGWCFPGLVGGGCAPFPSRSLWWDRRWWGLGGVGLGEGVRGLLARIL